MDRRTFFVALGAAGAALATSPTHAREAASARTYRYATRTGVDPNLLSLDLYGAPGQDRPLLAFIHGGGWRMGDKAYANVGREKAAYFNDQGFVYASLNYRLSPAISHPAHIQDVAAAIAWLHDHAEQQGIDPNRIFLMGHSAGAHLAALAGADPRWLAAHNKSPAILKGVVLLDGAGYDVTKQAPFVMRRKNSFLAIMYRDAFTESRDVWADASPALHVGPKPPPFLITHTARDDAARQSNQLAQALRAAGGEAEVKLFADKTHASIARDAAKPGDPVERSIAAALNRWGAFRA